ncbi:DUF4393 domain-containing protein [Streptococcus pluranimalium]|uniref:DUF4393 domain-containing protein n=1 Tax=Streptococcus pluranimalium TaxID=82348 RepID=UPI004046AB24
MSDLMPTILTAFATTMATKGAEAPAQTFNNLWQYVFGPVDNYLISRINKRQDNNIAYAKSITEKAEKIPKENIQEPPISILGPGLEASKFYIDEHELREMFANLLASSFDNRQNDIIHQSFIEIIKQLSPADAENLKIFFDSPISLPIANYLVDRGDGKRQPLKDYIFLSNPKLLNIDKQASSITNLKRLGLIDISFEKWLSDDNHYSKIDNNNLIDEYNSELQKENQKISVEKGIAFLTPFGRDFCRICLN